MKQKFHDSLLLQIILLVFGMIFAIGAVGCWVAAIWTHGNLSESFAGTGFISFTLAVPILGTSFWHMMED